MCVYRHCNRRDAHWVHWYRLGGDGDAGEYERSLDGICGPKRGRGGRPRGRALIGTESPMRRVRLKIFFDFFRRAHLAARKALNPVRVLSSRPRLLFKSSSHRPVLLLLSPSPFRATNPSLFISIALPQMTALDFPQSLIAPGPSSEPTSPTRTSAPTSPPSSSLKRRRQDKDIDMDRSAATGPIRNARKDKDVPRKKKAARACIHCQKAHLTCDDCAYPLMFI